MPRLSVVLVNDADHIVRTVDWIEFETAPRSLN